MPRGRWRWRCASPSTPGTAELSSSDRLTMVDDCQSGERGKLRFRLARLLLTCGGGLPPGFVLGRCSRSARLIQPPSKRGLGDLMSREFWFSHCTGLPVVLAAGMLVLLPILQFPSLAYAIDVTMGGDDTPPDPIDQTLPLASACPEGEVWFADDCRDPLYFGDALGLHVVEVEEYEVYGYPEAPPGGSCEGRAPADRGRSSTVRTTRSLSKGGTPPRVSTIPATPTPRWSLTRR